MNSDVTQSTVVVVLSSEECGSPDWHWVQLNAALKSFPVAVSLLRQCLSKCSVTSVPRQTHRGMNPAPLHAFGPNNTLWCVSLLQPHFVKTLGDDLDWMTVS